MDTNSLRIVVRAFWLAGEVILALIRFFALVTARGRLPNRTARAQWLHRACRRVLRVFQIDLRFAGPVPSSGLLVCNHLSYLDVLVLSALTPCVFVAKREVKRWPVFGWFASLAGTLFVRRDKRSDVARVTHEMRGVLNGGALLVLFPEGTTSGGHEVLPFKSALLEAAVRQPHALAAGFIEYALADGMVAEEVCYWKDMTLLPHLLNLLGKRRIDARLRFTRVRQPRSERKELARQLHSEVMRLGLCKVAPPVPTNPQPAVGGNAEFSSGRRNELNSCEEPHPIAETRHRAGPVFQLSSASRAK